MKFLFLLILFPYISIFSDTVIFKSGRILENVKTRMDRGTIRIISEDGKTQVVSKKEIKKVTFLYTNWKPLQQKKKEEQIIQEEEEKDRVAELSADGNEWEEREEEDKLNPTSNALLGLIPGYSGLYKTQNYKGAILFSVVETLAFLNFLDIATAKKEKLSFRDYIGSPYSAPTVSFVFGNEQHICFLIIIWFQKIFFNFMGVFQVKKLFPVGKKWIKRMKPKKREFYLQVCFYLMDYFRILPQMIGTKESM